MNYFDIAISIPLIWGAYKGFKKGFIVEIASLIGLALGIYGSVRFSFMVTPYLKTMFDVSDKLITFIAFIVTFIAIVLVIFATARLIQKLITMVALGLVNRIAGALFGILKFGLIVGVVLYLTDMIDQKVPFISPTLKESSIVYHPLNNAVQKMVPALKALDTTAMVDQATAIAK